MITEIVSRKWQSRGQQYHSKSFIQLLIHINDGQNSVLHLELVSNLGCSISWDPFTMGGRGGKMGYGIG
jgi:hypothetical protein